MPVNEKLIFTYEKLQLSCLMDDAYMRKFFEDELECTQYVLRIIMGRDDLIVKSSKSQKHMGSPGHEAYLDVYAVDSEGTEYDIEVQRASSGAIPQRARYYSAIMDTNSLTKGKSYSDMNQTVVIFITEKDVLGEKQELYRIERYVNGQKLFNDGSLIIYVNGENENSDTALGRLMHDFRCVNTDEMYSTELAKRADELKHGKGENDMQSPWEEMKAEAERMGIQQGLQKGIQLGKKEGILQASESAAINLLKLGKLSIEDIAGALGLSLAQVKAIAAGKM